MCERYIDQLLLEHSQLGTWPATHLTRDRISDSLVLRPALNPLSYTSQGCCIFKEIRGIEDHL